MDLADYRETYYTLSGKASDITRQLAFAGIALIWIFRGTSSGPLAVPGELLIPAGLLALALSFDLAQYAFGAAIWAIFVRVSEGNGIEDDTEVSAPMYFNWPALLFFWLKIFFLLLAYFLILRYIYTQLSAP